MFFSRQKFFDQPGRANLSENNVNAVLVNCFNDVYMISFFKIVGSLFILNMHIWILYMVGSSKQFNINKDKYP